MVQCVQCGKNVAPWEGLTYSNSGEPVCSVKCMKKRDKYWKTKK